MLNYIVDKIEDIDEAQRSLYTEKDGKFVLGIEGLPTPDTSETDKRIESMDAKIKELLSEKKALATKTKEAEDLAKREAAELAKKNGDTDALEASWQEKHDATVAGLKEEYEPRITELEGLLKRATVTTQATQLASELAVPGSAVALLPHIQSRLKMEIRDGQAVTVVTDADGKPSALSTEELKNEFIGNPAFAPLIVGSKAAGGGANSSDGGAGNKTLKRADFDAKSPVEKMNFVKDGGIVSD